MQYFLYIDNTHHIFKSNSLKFYGILSINHEVDPEHPDGLALGKF